MNHIDDIMYTGLHVAQLKYDNIMQTYNNFAENNGLSEKISAIDISNMRVDKTPEYIQQITSAIKTFNETYDTLMRVTENNSISTDHKLELDNYVKKYNDTFIRYMASGGGDINISHEILKKAINMIKEFNELLENTSKSIRLFTHDKDDIYEKKNEMIEKLRLIGQHEKMIKPSEPKNITDYELNKENDLPIEIDLKLDARQKFTILNQDDIYKYSTYVTDNSKLTDAIAEIDSMSKERKELGAVPIDNKLVLFANTINFQSFDILDSTEPNNSIWNYDAYKCAKKNKIAIQIFRLYDIMSSKDGGDNVNIATINDTKIRLIVNELNPVKLDGYLNTELSKLWNSIPDAQSQISYIFINYKDVEKYDEINKKIVDLIKKFKGKDSIVYYLKCLKYYHVLKHTDNPLSNGKLINSHDFIELQHIVDSTQSIEEWKKSIFEYVKENITKIEQNITTQNPSIWNKLFTQLSSLYRPDFYRNLNYYCEKYDCIEEYKKINFYIESTTGGGDIYLRESSYTKIYDMLGNLMEYARKITNMKQIYSSRLNEKNLKEKEQNIVARSAICHLCFIIRLVHDLKNVKANIRYIMSYGKFLKKRALLDEILIQKPHMKFTIDRMKSFCENVIKNRDSTHNWNSSNTHLNILNASAVGINNEQVIDILTLANIEKILN